MTKRSIKRGIPATHPGELLREDVLPALGKSKTEIAKLLGISRQTLYDILDEKQPVAAAMALRIGKLCGKGLASGSPCSAFMILSRPKNRSAPNWMPFPRFPRPDLGRSSHE